LAQVRKPGVRRALLKVMPRKARRAGKSENASASAAPATSRGDEGVTSKPATHAASAEFNLEGIRREGQKILSKLEEQVKNIDRMAEEYLDQGLIGHHCEALQMKERTMETLRMTRRKLGLPEDGSAPSAPAPAAAIAPQPPPVQAAAAAAPAPAADARTASRQVVSADMTGVEKAGSAAKPIKQASKQSSATGAAPPEAKQPVPASDAVAEAASQARTAAAGSTADGAWSTPAATGTDKPARYRWREADQGTDANAAVLEVSGVFADAGSLMVDVSATAVRISWPNGEGSERSNSLTLPLAFVTDSEACQVVRKKRTGELKLSIPRVASMPKHGPPLTDALGGAEGLGFVDSFMAGGEADALRDWFLDLWKRGELQPGEVEGGDVAQMTDKQSKFRSDEYIYLQEEGLATMLTNRLDRLVLHLAQEVPALKRMKLMRGRPMATVYAGKGSRYAPHFDAVGNDNGRVLTCILYLNPFWHEGDGAQIRFWPRSRGLVREGHSIDVSPLHGRLLAFLCNSRNLHEVVPVTDNGCGDVRVAVSCWYYDSDRIPAVCAGQRTADAPGL